MIAPDPVHCFSITFSVLQRCKSHIILVTNKKDADQTVWICSYVCVLIVYVFYQLVVPW